MVKEGRVQNLKTKDSEAHRLAEVLAALTGETLTRAVVESLRERRRN